jgi:hypothetical protein
MPLWGAVLALLNHSVHFIPLPYYHWSHKTVITSVARSGFFRKDIPLMLVYADHLNHSVPALFSRIVNKRASE